MCSTKKTGKLPIIGGISDFGKKYCPKEPGFVEKYFAPKSFERSCRLYEILGVRIVKKVVLKIVGSSLFRIMGRDYKDIPATYFIGKDRTLEALKAFEKWTRVNESVHLVLQISLGGYNFALAELSENYTKAIFWAFYGLTGLCCAMLQRYNRARIYNTIDESNRIWSERENGYSGRELE